MKNNPFADLRTQLGLPESRDTSSLDSTAPPVHAAKPARTSGPGARTVSVARAVVRMERAGRKGKEATVVEQLGLSPAELDVWLKALKATLGCGGSVEGTSLMLQGDHRKRLPAMLAARGVRKVIVG